MSIASGKADILAKHVYLPVVLYVLSFYSSPDQFINHELIIQSLRDIFDLL